MRSSHVWVLGGRRADRAAAASQLASPELWVDCDRRHRGPYTGVGTLLRAMVPDTHRRAPDLVARNVIAMLCAAPELEPLVGGAPGTLTSLAPGDERTRWYSPLRTRRIAHGLVEFLRDYAALRDAGPLTLGFDAADEADHTDQEFLAVALRRLDPAAVRLVVGTAGDRPTAELTGQLDRSTQLVEVTATAGTDGADGRTDEELARAFVASECTSDVPAERAAYDRLDPATREGLHDERAEELAALGEHSLRLGAIPYHRLRGRDPRRLAWPALAVAEDYCMGMGFYHAVLEYVGEMERLVLPDPTGRNAGARHHIGIRTGQVLALLDRPEETEVVYRELLTITTVPRQIMSVHYALGLLHTRMHRPDLKDHHLAKGHMNTAVAIASLLEDPEDRAFYTVFMRNGLALAEMHLGNLQTSLDLVTEGLERLDRELTADRHLLHRSVLRHNRAQVLAGLGRLDEALADFDEVVRLDPNYAEYHFDRGNARYQAGDLDGAIADYEHAMTLSRFTIDDPEYLAALDVLSGGADVDTVPASVLDDSVAENLVWLVGRTAVWLPYRVRRWPWPSPRA
jgi:tetratricopeptide (TPR) repeat protein